MTLSMNELLIPAIAKYLSHNKKCNLYEYFDGPFSDIEHRELNKYAVMSDIQPTIGLIKEAKASSILEIGTGTGRLIPHLVPIIDNFME